MRAVDTNVLVRIAMRDDEPQVSAAEDFVARRAWVSLLVLTEAMWVLSAVYKLRPEQIATAVEMFLQHQTLTIEAPEVVTAALAHFRRKPALGLSDCLVLEIARKAGHLPLGTFDRDLGKLPGAQAL